MQQSGTSRSCNGTELATGVHITLYILDWYMRAKSGQKTYSVKPALSKTEKKNHSKRMRIWKYITCQNLSLINHFEFEFVENVKNTLNHVFTEIKPHLSLLGSVLRQVVFPCTCLWLLCSHLPKQSVPKTNQSSIQICYILHTHTVNAAIDMTGLVHYYGIVVFLVTCHPVRVWMFLQMAGHCGGSSSVLPERWWGGGSSVCLHQQGWKVEHCRPHPPQWN